MEVLWKKVNFDIKDNESSEGKIDNKLAKKVYAKFRNTVEEAYNKLLENFKKFNIDIREHIRYEKELFACVIDDTIMDLNRLASFHPTKPNSLKYFAYFIYWFTTRKPFQIVKSLDDNNISSKNDDEKAKVLAKFYHFNEYLCSRMVFSAIFSENVNCKDESKHEESKKDWKREKDDLFYYLVYRNVEPKGLEAYLRAASLHNIWKTNLKFC